MGRAPAMTIGIEYLNHASALIEIGGVRLLSDPWFEGSAFSGGWGLAYDNADALQRAASATHLWISHWHSDHLHAPTLEKLAALNPECCVLANLSANFSMVDRLRALGFRNIVPVPEREPFALPGGVRVVRYPTAGIDNMLHIADERWSVLNYNDCNLPAGALRRLCRRMGRVDVLLTSYNHAGKLFFRASDDAIKQRQWDKVVRVTDVVSPRLIVPFASSHYYRSTWSRALNESLLSFDEMERRGAGDPRFAVLRIGDRLRVGESSHEIDARKPPLPAKPHELHDYGPSVAWDELRSTANDRSALLGRNFMLLGALAPELRVRIADLERGLALRVGKPSLEVDPELAHIVTHSRALSDWLGRRFGDDTFFAGSHFDLCNQDTRPIQAWALFTLLECSHMDPRSLLGYLANARGRRFLWNRGEEAWATLVGLQFKAGQLRV